MAIEAVCPNGHRILCPDDRAGRTAKCPKCSVPFRIPEPSPNGRGHSTPTAELPTNTVGGSGIPDEQVTAGQASTAATADDLATSDAVLAGGSGAQAVSAPTGRGDDSLIIFLCPNGHRLNGPARLAGKVGQCPHCGAKFQIPLPEEMGDEADGLDDTVTEDPLAPYADDLPQPSPSGQSAEPFEDAQTPAELESLFEAVRADTGSSVLSRLAGRSGKGKKQQADTASQVPPALPEKTAGSASEPQIHPLAELLARLWSEREHGGIIELHLTGGALLLPEWFDEKHSRGSHGLFAAQAADGTVTMTVVPWDEVSRVVVRGVVGLPDGLFE